MNETKTMNGFDCHHTFCHIEARHIFREGVILDEHCHQVTTREKFHDQVELGRVLKRVKELDDPGRV